VCVTSLHQGPLTGNQKFSLARVTPYLRVIKFDLHAPGDTVLTGNQFFLICVCVTSLHQGPLTGNKKFSLARVTPYLRVIKFDLHAPGDTVLTGNHIF